MTRTLETRHSPITRTLETRGMLLEDGTVCIWVNRCSIISQVIKSTSRCSKPQTLHNCLFVNLKSCFVFLNVSSRSARGRHVSVSIFLALVSSTGSTSRVTLLVVDLTRLSRSFLLCFAQHTSSTSVHGRLVSVSIFLALFCSTPRVALLVVDLSPSQSLLLWFAQHLESLCSLLTLSRLSQPFLTLQLALVIVQISVQMCLTAF